MHGQQFQRANSIFLAYVSFVGGMALSRTSDVHKDYVVHVLSLVCTGYVQRNRVLTYVLLLLRCFRLIIICLIPILVTVSH